MSNIDLEKEYLPSEWNKRFKTAEEIIENHEQLGTKVTQANKLKYKNKCLTYGNGKQENMDVYYKTQETDNSIFVFVHGGYWQMLSKDYAGFCVEPIVESGARVIILDYDLCPNVTLEEQVLRMKEAFKFIFNYARETNTKSIVIGGHSAGGHLVAKLLEIDMRDISNICLLKSAFFISGVYDLTVLWNTKAANTDNILTLNADNAKGLSPVFYNYEHLKDYKLSLHVYVAENESQTFIEQSRKFAEHLNSFKLNCQFKILNELDHFDIVEKLAEADYDMTKLILKELVL